MEANLVRFHMGKIQAADVLWAITWPEMWEGLKTLLHIYFPVYSKEAGLYSQLQGTARSCKNESVSIIAWRLRKCRRV